MGALLLEARLIKEQQPLFNKRLRRNRQLCSCRSTKASRRSSTRDVDFSHALNLYGLFAIKRRTSGAADAGGRTPALLQPFGP
jgi:excinuclease Cho